MVLLFCSFFLLPLAMIAGGVWVVHDQLSVKRICQPVEAVVVSKFCSEGPPCQGDLRFTNRRGSRQQVSFPIWEQDVGDSVEICVTAGGERVYRPDAEATAVLLSLFAAYFLVSLPLRVWRRRGH